MCNNSSSSSSFTSILVITNTIKFITILSNKASILNFQELSIIIISFPRPICKGAQTTAITTTSTTSKISITFIIIQISSSTFFFLAQHLFQPPSPVMHHIYNDSRKKQSLDQLVTGPNKDIWMQSTSNEFG